MDTHLDRSHLDCGDDIAVSETVWSWSLPSKACTGAGTACRYFFDQGIVPVGVVRPPFDETATVGLSSRMEEGNKAIHLGLRRRLNARKPEHADSLPTARVVDATCSHKPDWEMMSNSTASPRLELFVVTGFSCFPSFWSRCTTRHCLVHHPELEFAQNLNVLSPHGRSNASCCLHVPVSTKYVG